MIQYYIIEIKLPETGIWYKLDNEWPLARATEVLASLELKNPTHTYRMRKEGEVMPSEPSFSFYKGLKIFLRILFHPKGSNNA